MNKIQWPTLENSPALHVLLGSAIYLGALAIAAGMFRLIAWVDFGAALW